MDSVWSKDPPDYEQIVGTDSEAGVEMRRWSWAGNGMAALTQALLGALPQCMDPPKLPDPVGCPSNRAWHCLVLEYTSCLATVGHLFTQ
jgi:hypothetical protein